MDARPPHPNPYPLAHNPNHHPNYHQPPQNPQNPQNGGYPPSQPQPPVHIPFSADPYASARRDPFYPPTSAQQHVRQSSWGVPGPENAPPGERQFGWGNSARPHAVDASHHHSGPPPPPPMHPSHTAPNPSPYPYEASRRRSLGGASPPHRYGPPEPPPPPPSFARPHMPPPSSPQQQPLHNHASQPQRATYGSAFGGLRELPGLGQAHHRPGSSMSISSLIGGGDTGTPHQTSQSHPSPSMNAPHANSHSMQPPSPRRGPTGAARPEFPSFRRQPSPERHMYGSNAPRAPDGHTYTAGSPPRAYNNTQGSPDQGRSALAHPSQPYKPMVFQAQRPYASPLNDLHAREHRQGAANVPPRPNSQPSGPGLPEQESRASYDVFGQRRLSNGPTEERRRTLGESHHSRPSAAELLGLGGAPESSSDRDRPSTVQPVSQSAFGPPNAPRGAIGPQPPRSLWRHPLPEEPARETTEVRREEPNALYRGYGGYSAPPQGPSPYGGPGPEDMVRGRSLDHLNHRVMEQYHAPPTSDPTSTDRHKSEQMSRSLSSRSMYDQAGRSFLAFGPDANRRTGRASPLPQAVQGAQAQPLSIGKDPHVKSEFGRMFSGLGGLGSSTPSRGSPMPQGAHDSLPPGADLNEHLRMQRVGSQNGRKSKRVKDEDVFDEEDNDGRNTPLGMRGNKRNKHSHHHHHHAHGHHHHHHHKGDEEVLPATNGNGNANTPHHHHHYHGTSHHHHHAPRSFQAPLPSPPPPPKVHNIQPILDEAAKYPRKHLGSQLYETTTELPKPNSSLDDQFGYASKPKRLPRFSFNPINCTYTIRVPRFYLKPRQRQQIVLQRHLWGARIYRDDSDPIAAAIHSGWIRGEWDETVDVKMLDPRLSQPNDPSDAQDILERIPAAPVVPPADMDLQIELLVLPKLEEYAGTTEYGISSHKSSNHDGLSFAINKIRWVDDGMGSRGQERTAAALKRRLDASAALLSLKHGGDDAFRAVNGMAKLSA